MSHILVLGATGRCGLKVITQLPPDSEATAALRDPADVARLAEVTRPFRHAVVAIDDPDSLRAAAAEVDVVVNAIRLREDIVSTALVELHQRIVDAARSALIVTVGGAGALRMGDGQRFWQHPGFPARTLPRGRAHTRLRDHLESGAAGDNWAYLVPPPGFVPDGPATGIYDARPPAADESHLTARSISYADYATAVVDAVDQGWTGTHLIAG